MEVPAESYPWRCRQCWRLNKKTHVTCPNCHAHWSSGEKHNTEPKNSNVASYRDGEWAEWNNWEDNRRWSSRSPSRHRFDQEPEQTVQTPRQRTKGKGKGRKGKEGKSGGKDAPAETTSPFQALPAAGFDAWQQMDSTGFAPQSTSTASPFQLSGSDGGLQEMALALKRAYPDAAKRPEDVQILLDKADKEAGRLGLKNLQQAAKHLDRSKKHLKEVNDQKKAHRAMWLKHITEGIQVWERQLEEYRRHQAMLTDLASRATTEISSTSRAIQLLGAAGTGTALPSIQVPEAAEPLDQGEETADQEEDQLRQKLQAILRSCASSLGVNPEGGMPPMETKPEAEIAEDGKPEEKASKRPRSLEPFGGVSHSS